MKCAIFSKDGVNREVETTNSKEMNRLTELGYKFIEIQDVGETTQSDYIIDPVLREALQKLNNKNTVVNKAEQ